MPRRKQNVDMYGKSWSPIDIPNLEKAVQLYERLNHLQNNFANSLAGSSKIWGQINEQADLQNELQKIGIKASKEQCEEILKALKSQQQFNQAQERSSKYTNYTPNQFTNNLIDRANNISSSRSAGSNLSFNNAGSYFSGLAQQKYAQKHMDSNLKYFQDVAKSMGKDPNSKMVSKLAENKTVNELSKSSGKFNTAASVMQVAADTFKKAIDTFWGLFKDGMKAQYNTYNETFEGISVRTGMTRGQYFQNQQGAYNNLKAAGLDNNIKMSTIQTTWSELAKGGLGQEQLISRAIESALTKSIVPYLDTNSTNFQQLVDQQPQLMKQIRGIGRATNDLTGSSVFINKYLQDMVDNLAPMAAVAENELGVQFAQMSGTYEALRAAGLSEATIGELYKGSAAVYNDPLAALRSGNLDYKLAVVSGIANGTDFRDISQVSNEYLKSANFWSNLTPEGRWSPIFSGITGTGLSNAAKVELNEKNIDEIAAILNGSEVSKNLNKYVDLTTNAFKNDENQTAKTLQETYMENIATYVALIWEQIGYWGEVIAVLVKGIAGVVGAKIIGGIGKKILGIGGGSSSGLGATISGNLSAAGMSPGLAAASGVAGVAGIYFGVKGIQKGAGQLDYAKTAQERGYNDAGAMKAIGTTNVVGGTAAAVGGGILAGTAVAGMLGVGAANAWNPVGWVLLAAGAIALIGAAVAESIDRGSDANKIFDQLQAQTKVRADEMRREADEELSFYKQYQSLINQTNDLEVAKKLAVESGIVTEKELQDSKYDEIDAVKELVDEFISAKKRLSDETIDAFEDFSGTINRQTADFTAEYLNKFVGNKYNIQSGDDTWSVNQYGQQMQQMAYDFIKEGKISSTGENLDKNNQVSKHLAYMVKNGLLDKDYRDGNLTNEDYEILFMKGGDKDRRLVGEYMLTQEKYRRNMLNDESTQKITGWKYKVYANDAPEKFKVYMGDLLAAAESNNKEEAEEALMNMKLLGITSLDELGDSKSTVETAMKKVGINSFRTGLAYVPYDNYLANLHEGEAVITASTANELRNLIVEYRENQKNNYNLEAAIQSQTATLCNKLDEVRDAIQTNSFNNSSLKRTSSILANMKSMRSTKSFNSDF